MTGSVCGWCGERNPDIATHACVPEEHGWEQAGEFESIRIMKKG